MRHRAPINLWHPLSTRRKRKKSYGSRREINKLFPGPEVSEFTTRLLLIVKKLPHSCLCRKCKDISHVTLVDGPVNNNSPESTGLALPRGPLTRATRHTCVVPAGPHDGSSQRSPWATSEPPLPSDALCPLLSSPSTTNPKETTPAPAPSPPATPRKASFKLTAAASNEAQHSVCGVRLWASRLPPPPPPPEAWREAMRAATLGWMVTVGTCLCSQQSCPCDVLTWSARSRRSAKGRLHTDEGQEAHRLLEDHEMSSTLLKGSGKRWKTAGVG